MDVSEIVERLGLEPHPEGGFYGETYRAAEVRRRRRAAGAL